MYYVDIIYIFPLFPERTAAKFDLVRGFPV
jgi:hypothetical protein